MSEASPVRLAILIGSVRHGRIAPRVAQWFASVATQDSRFVTTVVDLIDLNIAPSLDGGADAAAFAGAIAKADAIVVVTPEYNRGYPGPLKNAIDSTVAPWAGKPVGFVAYGGSSGGRCSVEQLRNVFAELNAMTVRDIVSFIQVWDEFADGPVPTNAERAERAAGSMLDQLAWWSAALTPARQTTQLTV